METLTKPDQSKRKDIGIGYSSLAENLVKFSELGELPWSFRLEWLDDGHGTEAAMVAHGAKYHQACRLQYNNTKLQRAQKNALKKEGERDEEQPACKLTMSVWWYFAPCATIAASVPWPSSSHCRWNYSGSSQSSLNLTKFSASELYPIPMSFLFDWSDLVSVSVMSSWHIQYNFQSVVVRCYDIDGEVRWTSASLKLLDMVELNSEPAVTQWYILKCFWDTQNGRRSTY